MAKPFRLLFPVAQSTEQFVTDTTERPKLQGTECPRLNPMFMFRWEASQDSHVLLYPEGVVKLNATAGEIIGRCDGARSIDDIIGDLKSEFASDSEEIESGVRNFMEVAHAKGWIVV